MVQFEGTMYPALADVDRTNDPMIDRGEQEGGQIATQTWVGLVVVRRRPGRKRHLSTYKTRTCSRSSSTLQRFTAPVSYAPHRQDTKMHLMRLLFVLLAAIYLFGTTTIALSQCGNYRWYRCYTASQIKRIYDEIGELCNSQRIDGDLECNSFALRSRRQCATIPLQDRCDGINDDQGVYEGWKCTWVNGTCTSVSVDHNT